MFIAYAIIENLYRTHPLQMILGFWTTAVIIVCTIASMSYLEWKLKQIKP